MIEEQGLTDLLTPKWSPYIPHTPTPKQEAFLLLDNLDVFFGGAVGGGKSDALLMAALQYVDVPKYAALIVRATYKDLSLPDAIMARSKEWLMDSDARWNEQDKMWTFPNGAKLVFGHLDGPNDHFQYQSAAFQFIGVDEASQLRWNQIMYLFSRLRKSAAMHEVPLRFRMASNPGGRSHGEIYERYINPKTRKAGCVFIPAWLEDNPYLEKEVYEEALNQLDHITRKQLREGNWEVTADGGLFQRYWFPLVGDSPKHCRRRLRWWDLAASDANADFGGKRPDWTVGVKLALSWDGIVYLEDLVRMQESPHAVEKAIRATAEQDGIEVPIWMEQEPAASGKSIISHYSRNVLNGFNFRGEKSTGNKETYAKPLSAAAEAGNIVLVRGPYVKKLLDELEEFPLGENDDQVDAFSKAYVKICGKMGRAGAWGR